MPKKHSPERLQVKVGDVVQLHERVRDFETESKTPGHVRQFKDKITQVTISKVGTKYAYIEEGYREQKFDLETGREVGWRDGSATLRTEESLAAHLHRRSVLDDLRPFCRGYANVIEISADRLTTEALEELRDLLSKKGIHQ
ncbi:hypothetical protein KNU02_gp13 [Gordonia phage Pleakley]|uniref:Uncharacterized protein n=1 Tax=Gordonia phage Pleakley TaxID=2283246 RepID=A0A345M6D1_9CAUD|nr:hypothetical protein KNU02_gp13 [Gordonia phage Pleakley]AXH49739.1 hypothetical protein SEA_FURY_13 [Gordonia phage Fury]AXH66052.1 hypothetical protein SEA_PLEAKLEY_13 [Gordonia phage Pleakley]